MRQVILPCRASVQARAKPYVSRSTSQQEWVSCCLILLVNRTSDNPKQIHTCDFPGCDRSFFRADLRARHKERHTAKGSHLQRKDAFLNSQRSNAVTGIDSPSNKATLTTSPTNGNHAYNAVASNGYGPMVDVTQPYSSTADHYQSAQMTELAPLTTSNLDPQLGPYSTYASSMGNTHYSTMPASAPLDGQRFSFDDAYSVRPASQLNAYGPHRSVSLNTMPPPPLSSPQSAGHMYTQSYPSPASTNHDSRSSYSYPTMSSLPPSSFQQGFGSVSTRSGSTMSHPTVSSFDQQAIPNSRTSSVADFNVFDQTVSGYAMPVFGSESTLSRSPPPTVDDKFLEMLFSGNIPEVNDPPPAEVEIAQTTPPDKGPLPKLEPDGTPSEAVFANGIDINLPESSISEKKQNRLVQLISGFSEVERNPGRKAKAEILSGNPSDSDHVMSLQMLKTYITCYWLHIHQQMPILHRPTFNPETCPDLLLLAIMCLGAASLERIHPFDLSQMSAELAFFMAYHIRWEVFRDAEFRPTAKLWTFQTMLLLELFEKMYSTRSLHERAHIHHATTLTVMRRGSSLIGRSAVEPPKGGDDPTRTPPGPEGSINTSGQNTPDAYWNRWITHEATRRAAFAAFIIDSTHATLFGHSAVMSPHDIRLPLPCDEALWSATSSAEVQRVEASLAANGFKPVYFLDGLRKTLKGLKVRTNTFGRVILMAGLLNVSFHMNQRDLQVSSLNATSTLGNQNKWQIDITRALDFWRRDFDESLSKNDQWLQSCDPKNKDRGSITQRENVFEARTCLHSLAHMAMHVDIIDCQVFAGADRVLGRLVTDSDRAAVQRRMQKDWAPSARARDATFYALRFLCEVLIPEEELVFKRPQQPPQQPTFTYSARDDYLLNRPWVLFFAALTVWAYGYASDGPIRPSNYTLTSPQLQIFDMQRYLIRMGGVATPDDLASLKDKNSCLGLLLLLRERFQQPRWELLHEASETLSSCIDLLLPGQNSSDVRQSAAV